MLRYRERDFAPLEHADGVSPGWPIAYAELEPWYGRAERLFQVRGAVGQDPTEPAAFDRLPAWRRCPDEPAIAAVRERLAAQGVHPFSLPLAIDIERWLQRAATPWDAFPDTRTRQARRRDRAPGRRRCAAPTCTLVTGAIVERLLVAPDGRRIEGVEYRAGWRARDELRAGTVVAGRGRGELGRPAAALGHGRLPERRRQSLRRRRPLLHEPQLHRRCWRSIRASQQLGLPEDARHQRLLLRRRAGRPAARQCPAAGQDQRPDPQGQRCAGRPASRMSWLARAQRRLVPDERGPARSREPGPRRRRDRSSSTGAAPT